MQFTKSLKLGILALLFVALIIFSGCGGGNPVTPQIDDELDYEEVDRFDSITGDDGLATFNLEEDVKINVKVEDEKTGTPLSDIKVDMFLYEDKIVYLVVDSSGDYLPKIIVEEQSYKDYLLQSKIPIISTIVKLIERTEWALEGYTSGGAQFSDQIDNKFLKYLFDYIFQYGGKTTLGDIKYSMEDAIIAGADVVLSTGITVVFGLSGPIGWALIAIDVFDMGDTFAVAQWAKKYESLGYTNNDQFEVYYWVPAPYISSIKIPFYPFIVPIGEPEEFNDNNSPVISSLNANPSSIKINETTSITCIASDPDGDSLTYHWTKNAGSFEGSTSGPSVTWRAPSTADIYIVVSCEVRDGEGGEDIESINIVVKPDEKEEIESVCSELISALNSKNWNNARSYCIYGSEAYNEICDLEDLINKWESWYGTTTLNINEDINNIVINGNYATVYGYFSYIFTAGSYVEENSGSVTGYLEKIGSNWKIYKGVIPNL